MYNDTLFVEANSFILFGISFIRVRTDCEKPIMICLSLLGAIPFIAATRQKGSLPNAHFSASGES